MHLCPSYVGIATDVAGAVVYIITLSIHLFVHGTFTYAAHGIRLRFRRRNQHTTATTTNRGQLVQTTQCMHGIVHPIAADTAAAAAAVHDGAQAPRCRISYSI